MGSIRFGLFLSLGTLLGVGTAFSVDVSRAHALPGQTTEAVAAWIQGHPTLRPSSGEKLLVRKSDTAAQRFTFQASVLPPGKVAPPRNAGIIRSEKFSLFDMINGVTRERLEESLRMIYSPDIYQDYAQGNVVYAYPTQATLSQARNKAEPLLANIQGELRVGQRYAYWLEIAQSSEGKSYTGQITVLLKSDVEKLNTELRDRS